MLNELMQVVNESGIWAGDRAQTHAFFLSESVFSITREQKEELERLGYALRSCLIGLSHIATIAFDPKLNYSHSCWSYLRRVLGSGTPKIYSQAAGINVKDLPSVLKVDLMLDTSGRFRIAEIDGHNKHGLGYSTLGRRLASCLMPDAAMLSGTVSRLAEHVKSRGDSTLNLLYADNERFYLPEFQIVQDELERQGVKCILVSESDANDDFVSDGLFMDLPFMYNRSQLAETMLTSYACGRVRFLIPPKPYMGAKSVLALLRNDHEDSMVEGLLHTFIDERSLAMIRSYIPETFLVGKQATGRLNVTAKMGQKSYVLKKSIASGMKGTVFTDDPNFNQALDAAFDTNLGWILQEEVMNQPQRFSHFESGELFTLDGWLMRIAVHYIDFALGDVVVTARRDKAVHGAKDCIQLGCIVI